MSKLEEYKKFLDHIKTSSTTNQAENFPHGFGQFTELLLSDDLNSWSTSNHPYYKIVQEIKAEFLQSNRQAHLESLKNSLLTSFYTPDKVCQTVINSLPINAEPIRILEPSAGTGNFITPLLNKFLNPHITAVEKDPKAPHSIFKT